MSDRMSFARVASLVCVSALVMAAVRLPISEARQAKAEAFAKPYDIVWTTIVQVLQGRGESITQADKENGLINTDFRSEDKDKKHYKLNLLVMKTSDSTTNVSVTSTEEKRSGSIWANKRGRWEAKDSDGSHEKALLEEVGKALQ